MKVSYHIHSVVQVFPNSGHRLIIDPFIEGNEGTDLKVEQVKVDYILLTHAHSDHFGDTVAIAKANQALVICNVELAGYLASQGVQCHGMQPGGSHRFDFGRVTFTQAIHGSSLEIDGLPVTLGLAAGIIIEADDQVLYHLGDTALFSDLKLYGDLFDIDLALVPIGDNFTMGPRDALLAAQWLKAKHVMPVHYNTFPLIKQDPQAFVASLPDGQGLLTDIGEVIEL